MVQTSPSLRAMYINMRNGLMSSYLSQQAQVGEALHIRGPMGDCFYYNPEQKTFPIVLVGTGTGLAPLIGIARDALENNHNGNITLIHGGVDEADLYQHEELNALQIEHANFSYLPCVLNESALIPNTSIDSLLTQSFIGIESDVYLFVCGPEETTKKMKLKAFLAGVPSASIYSDAFVTASK